MLTFLFFLCKNTSPSWTSRFAARFLTALFFCLGIPAGYAPLATYSMARSSIGSSFSSGAWSCSSFVRLVPFSIVSLDNELSASWWASYTHLPCVRSTGYTNLVRMDGSKRTRDSSNTSRNGSKRTRNSSNSSTKQQKAVRNFEPTNIMGGTNISEGVQRFQVVSEIFVPGGPDISGVQIFRDRPTPFAEQ